MDVFAIFDDKSTMAGGTFNIGNVLSLKSYDQAAAGTPAAVGPGGAIGGTLLHDIGRGTGRRINLHVQITTAAVGATATLDAKFVCADDAALTTNLTILLTSTPIAVATLVAGYRFRFGSIPGVIPRRFLGMQYVVATANFTAGAMYAALCLDSEDHADILG